MPRGDRRAASRRSRVDQRPAAPASASRKRQALGRVGGVERQVGAAGLEDAEHAATTSSGERSTRTPTTWLGADAQRAQAARRARPARRCELAVGEEGAVVLHGDGVRRGGGARREETVDGRLRVDRSAAGAARGEDLPPLAVGEERQRRKRLERIGRHRGEQGRRGGRAGARRWRRRPRARSC